MATVTKGKVLRRDLNFWDGISKTASRVDSSGGTITGVTIGDAVDVLEVYGSGTDYTLATMNTAKSAVGSNNVSFIFATGTWAVTDDISFPSNITVLVPAGCVFNVSSGKTFTINGHLNTEHTTWHSGSGTVAALGTVSGAHLIAQQNINVFRYMTEAQIADVQAGTLAVDVTTALNNAASAMASNKTLYFPPGAYRVAGTAISLTALNQVKISGYNARLVQYTTTATTMVLNSGKQTDESAMQYGFIIEGIDFEMATACTANTGTAVDADGTYQGIFRDCRFENHGTKAVSLAVRDTVHFDNCTLINNIVGLHVPDYSTVSSNPQVLSIQRCNFSGVVATEANRKDIHLEKLFNHVSITECTFVQANAIIAENGITGAGGSGNNSNSEGLHIERCTFETHSGTAGRYYIDVLNTNTARTGYNVVIRGNTFESEGPVLRLAKVTGAYFGENFVVTDDDGVIVLDANCADFWLGQNTWLKIANFSGDTSTSPRAIIFSCARSEIHCVYNRMVGYSPASTSLITQFTNYGQGDTPYATGLSTASDQAIDMSAEIAAVMDESFANILPPLAYTIHVRAVDAGGGNDGGEYFRLKPVTNATDSEATNYGVRVPIFTNEIVTAVTVPCDADGNLVYDVVASGANTAKISLALQAVHY